MPLTDQVRRHSGVVLVVGTVLTAAGLGVTGVVEATRRDDRPRPVTPTTTTTTAAPVTDENVPVVLEPVSVPGVAEVVFDTANLKVVSVRPVTGVVVTSIERGTGMAVVHLMTTNGQVDVSVELVAGTPRTRIRDGRVGSPVESTTTAPLTLDPLPVPTTTTAPAPAPAPPPLALVVDPSPNVGDDGGGDGGDGGGGPDQDGEERGKGDEGPGGDRGKGDKGRGGSGRD